MRNMSRSSGNMEATSRRLSSIQSLAAVTNVEPMHHRCVFASRESPASATLGANAVDVEAHGQTLNGTRQSLVALLHGERLPGRVSVRITLYFCERRMTPQKLIRCTQAQQAMRLSSTLSVARSSADSMEEVDRHHFLLHKLRSKTWWRSASTDRSPPTRCAAGGASSIARPWQAAIAECSAKKC